MGRLPQFYIFPRGNVPYKGGSSGEVWFVKALGTLPFHVDPAHDPDTPFPHFPAPDKVLAPGNVWVCGCVCLCSNNFFAKGKLEAA